MNNDANMDDWKNWKVGDIVRVVETEGDSFDVGVYTIDAIDPSCPDLRIHISSGWPYRSSLKFVSREGCDGNQPSDSCQSLEAVDLQEQSNNQWSGSHYDFYHVLTSNEMGDERVKVDPYFVSNQWKLGSKDESGVLFHILKTLARFGDKNPREREIIAIYKQIKRLAELEGVALDD